MDPVTPPPLAENVATAVNLAAAAQVVKSNVRLTDAVAPGFRSPTIAGRGVNRTGVHAAPNTCVSVKVLICALCAVTTPASATLTGQTRAFWGPLLVKMLPPNTGLPGTHCPVPNC